MKLKMLSALAGGPNLVAGDIIDQPEDVAKAWIEAGLAEQADEKAEPTVAPHNAGPAEPSELEPRPEAEVQQASKRDEYQDDIEMPSLPNPEPPKVAMDSETAPEPEVVAEPVPQPQIIEESVARSAPQTANIKRKRAK